jgi:hypothetical protein
VVVALMAVHDTGVPLVNVVPQGFPLPSEMVTVAPLVGVKVGVSEGAVPALTVDDAAVKVVIAAGVTTICLVAVATVEPIVTVSV